MLLVRATQTFIIAVVMLVCYYWAPKIDGYVNPVLSNPEITVVKNTIYNTITVTEIEGTVTKRRDCAVLSFEFFVGVFPNSYSVVRVDDLQELLEAPARPRNDVHFGPFRIYAPVDMLRISSFAIITHQCYSGFLWNTETIMRLDRELNKYEIINGPIPLLPTIGESFGP